MPCVEISEDADANKEEKPLNENITGKKPAKIVEHEDYKKTLITDVATKVQEIENIDAKCDFTKVYILYLSFKKCRFV